MVTELAFHKKSTIDADISFLSELEWRQELEVLLHDLVDEGGGIKRITDLKSDAGVAWQKVRLTSSLNDLRGSMRISRSMLCIQPFIRMTWSR